MMRNRAELSEYRRRARSERVSGPQVFGPSGDVVAGLICRNHHPCPLFRFRRREWRYVLAGKKRGGWNAAAAGVEVDDHVVFGCEYVIWPGVFRDPLHERFRALARPALQVCPCSFGIPFPVVRGVSDGEERDRRQPRNARALSRWPNRAPLPDGARRRGQHDHQDRPERDEKAMRVEWPDDDDAEIQSEKSG